MAENATVGELRVLLGRSRGTALEPEYVAVAKPFRFKLKDTDGM